MNDMGQMENPQFVRSTAVVGGKEQDQRNDKIKLIKIFLFHFKT